MRTRIKELLKRLASIVGLDTVRLDGQVLPASYLRLCGLEFRDDAYFLASARAEADRLVRDFGLSRAGAVLDIGCGFGRLAIGIADRIGDIARYHGIDVSAAAVAWCRRHITRKHPTFRFERVDVLNERYNPGGTELSSAYRLPFADGEFDVVYLYSVFSHMELRDMELYVREISRVVRGGGGVFVTMHVAEDVPDVTINPADGDRAWQGPLHCVRYRRAFVEELFRRHSLAIEGLTLNAETDGQSGYSLRRV